MSELAKERKITLNEKEYAMKFNFKTILNFEKATGKNFFKLGGEFSGTDLITLLWAMLVSGGHQITVEKTAEIVDFSNLNEINAAINELTKSELPDKRENSGGDSPLEETPRN